MINWTSSDVAVAVAAFLTPLAVVIWKSLFPVSSFSEFDFRSREELKRRNNWIDRIATLLMFVGLMSFVFPYAQGTPPNDPIGGALGLGLMMWLPGSFVMAVTLPHGTTRFREFLRWYELKWGIGIRGITYVYVPFFVFGAAALCYALQWFVA